MHVELLIGKHKGGIWSQWAGAEDPARGCDYGTGVQPLT
jgi:hypothetical protein